MGTASKWKKQHWLRRHLDTRLPITQWLPNYNTEKALADVIAGVTVGLTVIPQALAYATLGGLEPQYGLYSSFVGCFVYAIFGSCKDITIGPTALMALMTYQQIHARNTDFAVLLCFLTGLVQFLMGLLHLGVLIDFISIPVTVGFTSATSVIIAVSQLKSLLGLKFQGSDSFLDTVTKVITNMDTIRIADSILGFSCIAVLLLMRKLKDVNITSSRKVLKKTLWLLSTSRNALVVIFCSLLAYMMHDPKEGSIFKLTGTVRSGLPPLSLPPFETTLGNRTLGFTEMCSELGSSILLVPIIGVLGNVAIAKAFASSDSVDATQELVTLSLCNVFGSFVGAMPVTGSFSRSAVNHASGVATQLGGIFTGILVLLSLSLLTPYFYFIPKAALAAVVICAVIFMIEYEVVKPMWRSRRADLVPAFVTFSACLLCGVELGILAGVVVNVALLLYPNVRPQITVDTITNTSGTSYLLITIGNSLYFPGVEYIRQFVARAAKKQGSSTMPVVIDCRLVLGVDYTAAKGICALAADLGKHGQPLLLLGPNGDVSTVLSGAGSMVAVIDVIEDLEYALADVSGHVLMPLLKDTSERETSGDMTPPPSYNSLPQVQEKEEEEDVIQVVIADGTSTALISSKKITGKSNCYGDG